MGYFLSTLCKLCNYASSGPIFMEKKILQESRVGIPITGLPLPYLCACPKSGSGFPMPYVMVFLCSMI